MAHIVEVDRRIGKHDEVGFDNLLKHVQFAGFMGHFEVVVVEICGAVIIPVRDALKHIPHGREVEDVPIERVADGKESRPPGRGVVIITGFRQKVGSLLQRPNEVHQAFEVGIGFQGSLEHAAHREVDHIGVAQIFHISDEGVGRMDGGQVAPVGTRLWK